MNPEEWQNIKGIFNSALEVSFDNRDEFLKCVCGQDPEIRDAVDELQSSYRTSFLDNGFPADDSMSDEDTLPPGGTLRHYEIVRMLGEGGMGKVYLAYDKRLARNASMLFLRVDPIFDGMRGGPRFQDLLRRIGLVS